MADGAQDNLPRAAAAPLFARATADIQARLIAERERWLLWLPVLIGLGIGAYFALPVEPTGWLGPLAATALVAVGWQGRARPSLLLPATAFCAVAMGFAAAQLAAAVAAAPVLAREVGPVRIEGRVAETEAGAAGQRAVLDQLRLDRGVVPAKVRLTLPARSGSVRPGQRIAVLAMLRPPPEPALPGGFDFARQAWFESLGGVGFAVGPVTVLEERAAAGPVETVGLVVAALRRLLTDRILAAVPGDAGAVTAAMLTGERAAIGDATWDAYRDSGLAHLLSISGLHMSMVAGLVFAVVRGALALVPPLALRYPIKKWTAVVALAATFAYLLLAGAPVPTQRSFLMIALVLLAVLIDRTAISMRTVAWAAAAVLLWQPHAMVGASFQMSFAAVVALVAAFELLAPRLAVWRGDGGPVRAGLLYVGGIALTTVIAGTATAFYAAHHFSRFASWSVAANLVAVPISGFVVMPFGLLGLLLTPLGLEAWPLRLAGWGMALINATAAEVASWPGAAVTVPAPSVWALALFSLGGLWLCLWRGPWRLWGGVPLVLALASLAFVRPPDVLVAEHGGLMAVRGGDGGLLLSATRGERLLRDAWQERAGAGRPARGFGEAAAGDGLACDSLGCLYRAGGHVVALAKRPEALAEDCGLATVVVSAAPVRRRCAASVVIDRFATWRDGGHAIWLEAGGARVETVRARQGERPWTRRPARREDEREE